MNRRQFCKKMVTLASALALAPVVEACTKADTAEQTAMPLPASPTIRPPTLTSSAVPIASHSPTPTATHSSTPTMIPYPPEEMTQIAFVKTTDRAEGVRRAIGLLGINPINGDDVLLKPNFNSADPPPASTHNDVLRQLVVTLNDMGARSITVGERSGMGSTRRVMEEKGVFDLSEELGFNVVVFDELEERDFTRVTSGDFYWSNGFAVPKMLADAACVVQTCCLKTHGYGGHFTMSLKNSVGFVPYSGVFEGVAGEYMDELHTSGRQRSMIAEINTAYTSALIVMDGVEAFRTGGPAEGSKVEPGVVVAGTDRIAVDAVGVAILRLFGTVTAVQQGNIFDQEQIARAVELGLGVKSPAGIEFITDDDASAAYAAQIREMLVS